MTVFRLSSVSPSIIDISSDQLAEQMEAVLDGLRRQYGNAEIARSGFDNVLLATQYALYVNPEIGSDDYAPGSYNSDKKILNQEYHCGYSPYRPFKTLARAYAEVARRSILAGPSNDIYDRAVIFIDLTDATLYNGRGTSNVQPWSSGAISANQLNALNDATRPGLIHPRGVSLIGRDLRRSIIRPSEVPQGSGNAITGRFPIFRVTGGSYFCNFTIKDKLATPRSHHLVHSHEFCSQADLVTYYSKIQTIFGLIGAEVINPGETEIVGPAPDGDAIEGTDTVQGSSPYIFGCSLRSEYGLCGPLLDGRVVSGFKSMEAAQYTIINLQKDWSAYERFNGTEWIQVTDFADYLGANINDIRYRVSGNQDLASGTYTTDYRHFGFKFIGDAFIQEVSEFVIGAAVHHWGASGSNADLSNCNSAFGGMATLAHGFRGITTAGGALPQDQGFAAIAVRRPQQIKTDGSNIKQIGIGRVASNNGYVEVLDEADEIIGAYIQLEFPLDPAELLRSNGVSLRENHYVWISNSNPTVGPGADPINADGTAVPVRARLAAVPWTSEHPDRIYVKPTGTNNITTVEEGLGVAMTAADLAGNLVYVRRLVDTRLPEQREYSVILANGNTAITRRPQGNFIFRLGGRSSRAGQLDPANGSDEIYLVSEASRIAYPNATPGTNYYKVLLRAGDAGAAYANNTLYRPAVPVTFGTRVFRSIAAQKGAQPDGDTWVGSNLQLSSARGIEWPRSQAGPRLVVDKDISPSPTSLTLGINFGTDTDYLDQLRSASDFQAVARLMTKLGYSGTDLGSTGTNLSGKVLDPQTNPVNRDWKPDAETSPVPAGKLTQRGAWPVEFNLPTTIEARNQIFRYIGLLNYSKALPKYQRSVLSDQFKLDAVATSLFGGRSYADGSIENGLTIQGDRLTDLSTGRDFTTENVGIGALSEISAQTSNTLVGDYTISGNLDIQEDLTVGGDLEVFGQITQASFAPGVLPPATSTQAGIIRLATSAEAAALEANDVAVTPANLTNAVSSAIKGVMNMRLSLTGASPVPVESQSSDTLFLHPFGGNDVALFNPVVQRWGLFQITAVRSFPLAGLALPNVERNYDVYLYNAGTATAPDLRLDLVVWPQDRTPPTRGSRDGVLMKAGDLSRRLVGVIRVLADGTSRVDLGGVITGAQSANYPRVFLANLYNTYDTSVRYWLGTSWNSNSQTSWGPAPANVYAAAPRIAWVQAASLLATAYLSIYNDQIVGTPLGNLYVSPGLNSTVLPAADSFTAESQAPNTTVLSPWSRVISPGFQELYYLWLVRPGGNSIVNQHTNNGMLAMLKV
jgi:hypothetical protein